jgi:hypothetical protein
MTFSFASSAFDFAGAARFPSEVLALGSISRRITLPSKFLGASCEYVTFPSGATSL